MMAAGVAAAVAALSSMHAGGIGLLVGKGGGGKSTIAQKVASSKSWSRHVVVDTYAALDRDRAELGRSKRHVWRGQMVEERELAHHPELLDRKPLNLVVYSERGAFSDSAAASAFANVARMVLATGDVDLVLEESGRYSRSQKREADGSSAWETMNIIASGCGHFGGRALLIAQRPMRVTPDVREALSVVVACALPPSALGALLELTGDKDFVERVRKLRAACGAGCAEGHAHLRVPDPPEVLRL